MPAPALIGTYPLPGMPGATVTAGLEHVRRQLAHIFRNGPVRLAEDIETRGLGIDGRYIKCVTLSTAHDAVVLNPREPGDAAELLRAQDYANGLDFHTASFDVPNLAHNRLFPIHIVDKVVDIAVDARMTEPGLFPAKTLDALTERHLGLKHEPILNLFRSLGYKTKADGFRHLDIDSPAYLFGAASDGVATARLAPILERAAVDRQLNHPFGGQIGLSRYEAQEMRAERQEHNRWALESQIRGLLVDFDYLENFRRENSASMSQARAYLAGLGVENGNQLVEFLAGIGAIPGDYPLTKGGKDGKNKKLSTAAESLELLNHPLAQIYGTVVKQEKLDGYLQKCVDLADDAGRIHPSTGVLKAAHGRDAMSDPPLHQFPGGARGIILFDETGTSTDWSQQEPRVAMNLAGDIGRPLLDYEQQGIKIYKGIAEYADIPMDTAKVVVLAGLYGEGQGKLSADLGLSPDPWLPATIGYGGKKWDARWGYAAAKDVQNAVFSAIPRTYEFMQAGKRIARDHGLAWTMAGRIVPIPSSMFMGKFGVQAHKWINYCVSGSANDEISRVIVQARRMGFGHLIWFGMHDELLHANSVAREVRQLMETPSERFCRLSGRVPVIRTDTKVLGERWAKA